MLSLLLFAAGSTATSAISSLVNPTLGQPDTSGFAAASSLPRDVLAASSVHKPAPIPSVQAFDAQLVLGGKDEALRKAVDTFKSAAKSVERGSQLSERYWMDALKIRRKNWSLIPAPLPWDSASMKKGADRTAKDFLISYGLETCMYSRLPYNADPSLNHTSALPIFRRRAVGQMASYDTSQGPVVFPHRRKVVLRVSLASLDTTGIRTVSYNRPNPIDESSIDGLLRSAQREAIEEEIFAHLIEDAGKLPTTSVRVSERSLIVEATDLSELRFELVCAVVLIVSHATIL